MIPVSGVNTGAGQPVTGAEKVLGAPKIEKAEGAQSRPPKPVMDEYVPEEPREPSGLYWMGRDEDGQPRICFDDPEQTADVPQKPEDISDAKEPEKGGEELCVGNTGKVDREIEKLKKKREELEQRISTETDEDKVKELERQLAQVERELKQKDNDTYRKQHSTFIFTQL